MSPTSSPTSIGSRLAVLVAVVIAVIGCLGAFASPAKADAPDALIAYWNFNDGPPWGNPYIPADVGDAVIDRSGWGGTVNGESQQWGGTNLNALFGDAGGQSIAFRRPQWGNQTYGNGTWFEIQFSMEGRRNLFLSYATRRFDGDWTGFTSQTWFWSTNGIDFEPFEVINLPDETWKLVELDFSAIEDLDDSNQVILRVVLDGGAGLDSQGNLFDNIQVHAEPIAGPGANPPSIGSVAPGLIFESDNSLPAGKLTLTGLDFVAVWPPQPGDYPTVSITHVESPGIGISVLPDFVNGNGSILTVPESHLAGLFALPPGLYDVTVTRPDGESGTLSGGFTIAAHDTAAMTMASRWGGPVHGADISEDGAIAYIANGRMFRILDLSDESNPVELSSLYLGNNGVSDVKVRDGYAFLTAYSSGFGAFRVVDVSDPFNPDLVWAGSGGGFTVELWGDYAYAGAREGGTGIRVYDISDPLSVVSLGTVPFSSDTWAFTIDEGKLYVGRETNNTGAPYIRIFDLAVNPANPPQIGTLNQATSVLQGVQSIAAAGDYLYLTVQQGSGQGIGNVLRTVDISNPGDPVIVSEYDAFWHVPTALRGRIGLNGGRLYVPEGGHRSPGPKGLWIFDAQADPAQPTLITTYLHHPHINATTSAVLAATDDRVYLWDSAEGFILLDVSDSANPQRLGTFHSPAKLGPMAKAPGSDLLYVSDAWGGFTVLDVSDSASPQVVSNYIHQPYDHGYPPGFGIVAASHGIAVEGDRAYITLDNYGLEVIDISDPENPQFLNVFRPNETMAECALASPCKTSFEGLAVRNGLAHIGVRYAAFPAFPGQCCEGFCGGCGGGALLTIDVADAENLFQYNFAHVCTGCVPERIALSGDVAFLAYSSPNQVTHSKRYVGGITTPFAALIHTQGPGGLSDIALHKNVTYATRWLGANSGLYIRDVTDPANPVLLTIVNSDNPAPGPGGVFDNAYAVDVQNDRAYVVASPGGAVRVLDVADPAAPFGVASTTEGGIGHSLGTSILVDEPNVYVTRDGTPDNNVANLGLAIINVHGLPKPPPTCPGDLTKDGAVDGSDLLVLLGAWGDCPGTGSCPADLNADGVVDGSDLLILLGNWGACPEP